jgi:hypothetical protein
MQVIALDDYVIPRKDGFWRILLPSKSLPPDVWAVPLGKSKDVIAEQERAAIFFPAGGPPAVSAYRTKSPDVFA